MSFRANLRPILRELPIYDVPPLPAEARLHANECPEPWPLEVMHALADVVARIELGRYPDTSGRSLRRVLGQRHGCDPDRVVLGNGSDEVISLLLTALSGGPRPILVVPAPTFVMYAHSARVLGYEVREVALDEQLELVESQMDRALDGATICFLARPNNPTSSCFDADVVERLAGKHPETVFVIDEAYAAYSPGSSLWRADRPENWVHMGTLSKVGLAALRVGYCVAHPDLVRALDTVRHPYNVSATSLALAETILVRFADVQQALVERTIHNRARLAAMLGRIPGAHVYPAHANLVLARVGGRGEASTLTAALAERGIRIKDLSDVPALAGCVRVSVGTSAELDLLERALAELT